MALTSSMPAGTLSWGEMRLRAIALLALWHCRRARGWEHAGYRSSRNDNLIKLISRPNVVHSLRST